MSLEKIREALDAIEIPKEFQSHSEIEFEDIRDEAQDKVKEKFDEIWTLLFDDREKFQKFIIAYERDKLAILNNYIAIFKKGK